MLPFPRNSCHAFEMAKFRQLQDLYWFPGFRPLPRIRGVFGDPKAVRISLQRRRKKRSVEVAVKAIAVTTTSAPATSAISPVATSGSICASPCAGSSVHGAGA